MIAGSIFSFFVTMLYGLLYIWMDGNSLHFGDPANPFTPLQSFFISFKSWVPSLHHQVKPATAIGRSLFSTQIACNVLFVLYFICAFVYKFFSSLSYEFTVLENFVQFVQSSVSSWSSKKIYICSPYGDMYKNQFRHWKVKNVSFVNSPEEADVFLLIVSAGMKTPPPGVVKSISSALAKKIPIICMNQTGTRRQDRENCPELLDNQLALHISVEKNPFHYALKHWVSYHKACVASGYHSPHYYPEKVYTGG